MTTLNTSNLTKVALATALIVVFSQISIPMPYGVPMTLQTFIIPLVGIILGSQLGALSAVIYLLLGMIGLPVFSGFSGGASLLGPTGGFLISFPILAFCAGWGCGGHSRTKLYSGLILGMTLNFLIGWWGFKIVTGSSSLVAFNATVLPFIPTTIIKIICTGVIGEKLSRTIRKKVYR